MGTFKEKLAIAVGKAKFTLNRKSPELLIGAAVIGLGVSTIMAIKASKKADEVIATCKADILDIKEDQLPDNERRQELAKTYGKAGLELVKIYGPSVALWTLSIGGVVTAHGIMKKRNFALAAAYTALDGSFKEYRKRIIEGFGPEFDKQIRSGVQKVTMEEKVIDANGNETTVTKEINVEVDRPISEYARFYDSSCVEYIGVPESDLAFLLLQEAKFNQLLVARGHVFLNEVYDALDIPRTEAGQHVGWMYNPEDKTIDSCIDFGLRDANREGVRRFVNGYESVILLDFNVDGPIVGLFEGKKKKK